MYVTIGPSNDFWDSYCYNEKLFFYNALHNLDNFKVIRNWVYESPGPLLKGPVPFSWYHTNGLLKSNNICS